MSTLSRCCAQYILVSLDLVVLAEIQVLKTPTTSPGNLHMSTKDRLAMGYSRHTSRSDIQSPSIQLRTSWLNMSIEWDQELSMAHVVNQYNVKESLVEHVELVYC